MSIATNLFLLKDATLDTIALTVDNAGVNIADVANLTVSGELALAQVTANGESQSRYMTLQMGNVTVDGSLDADLVDLTATFEIAALDLNLVNTRADGTPWTHLNWNQAVDLDEDGTHDVLNPGADLPNPRDLTLNLEHTLRFRLSGRMEGIGTTTNGVNNAFLTIKDGEDSGRQPVATDRHGRIRVRPPDRGRGCQSRQPVPAQGRDTRYHRPDGRQRWCEHRGRGQPDGQRRTGLGHR